MEKQELVTLIKSGLAEGVIARDELVALASGAPAGGQHAKNRSVNLVNAFYAIGAIIAIVGVGILVAQNWLAIGFVGRVLVTLGLSVTTFVGGMFFLAPHQRIIAQVLFVISAALAPLGVYVVLQEGAIRYSPEVQIAVALGLALVFGAALFIRRLNVLTLILIAFMTWAYYALLAMNNSFSYDIYSIYKWATLVLGIAYILVGYGYPNLAGGDPAVESGRRGVRSILYAFGTLMTLGAAVSFGGVGDILAIAAIFAFFYGGVLLKSRIMLILAALFLIGHTIHITAKYFVDSIGWPIALIAVGFLIIGIGYGTYYVSRRFISSTS